MITAAENFESCLLVLPHPMGPSGLSWEGTPTAGRAPYQDLALRGASLRVGNVQPGSYVTDTYTVRAEK